MPSFFHSNNIQQLQERINRVNREIDSLMKFRTKCENRIQHLRDRNAEQEFYSGESWEVEK